LQLYFPQFKELPHEYDVDIPYHTDPDEGGVVRPAIHWCFLGENFQNISDVRPRFVTKDRAGHPLSPAFHLDDPWSFDRTKYQVGETMCIMYPHLRDLLDMSQGLRIEVGITVAVCNDYDTSLFRP
jgi:hypothetical protein